MNVADTLYGTVLVLSSVLVLELAFPCLVWPLPVVSEALGSAPPEFSAEAPPVVGGGATSKKRRLPLLLFGYGGPYRFHLIHHFLSLFGKLRAKEKGSRILKVAIVSDDW